MDIFGTIKPTTAIPDNVKKLSLNDTLNANVNHVKNTFNDNVKNVEITLNDSVQNTLNATLNDEKAQKLNVNLVQNPIPLMAVWPEINPEAFALTMDRYRIYIAKLNEFRKQENKKIAKHNISCPSVQENEVKQTFAALFLKKYNSLSATEYNAKVDEFLKEKGIQLKKKKLHIIKYQSELVFQQFLYQYSLQLNENTKVFRNLGVTDKRVLKMLEINSYKIVIAQRNGVNAIDVCGETVKNHRKHLIEAGVLLGYTFCGHKRGVKVNINREILSVFDAFTQKITTSENQLFTSRTAKVFGNNKDVTETKLNKINIKENVDNISLRKGTPSAHNSFSYQNTKPQYEKDKLGGAAKNVKISEKLENLVLHEVELANQLASGAFNFYNPLDIRELHHEAVAGTLSRETFKEVIIQDFFKSAARLYRNSSPYFGSWLKAYRNWMDKKFFVGQNLYNKSLMVDKLQEYRWRLNHAHKWFTAKKVTPLYPGNYFDFTRTESKEIGFEYTRKAYLKNKKAQDERLAAEQKANIAAAKRKETINHAKKFDQIFKRFMNNRISLNEMLDYIKNNLPGNYQMKVSERLNEYASKKH